VAKTFVGIGFGPIQSGLFLLEADASRNFERLVVAEVVPDIVAAVRKNGGQIRVNVAGEHGIAAHELTGLEIYNPLVAADAARLVDAIAEASEIATALPSVDFFCRGSPSSAELLARGIERKMADRRLPRAIIYAAENHNHAAERLQEAVTAEIVSTDRPRVKNCAAFLNTVIGKMSGVVADPHQIERDGLAPLVEGGNHAVLVEKSNRIFISQIPFVDFQRGITVFQEKPYLLPFEEAKLYGHNATHALLGYLAHRAGLTFMHEANAPLRRLVEHAFLEESGRALCHRHSGVDPLFTQRGWTEYVDNLMQRMVNPYLQDRVDRVIRDPRRKLAWNDRFIGTMRLAIEQGIDPRCYAIGAAAAVELLQREQPANSIQSLLTNLWQTDGASAEDRNAIIQRIDRASQYELSSPFPLSNVLTES
jgi:mannitol-1-phosphate 5-dehydrogenase